LPSSAEGASEWTLPEDADVDVDVAMTLQGRYFARFDRQMNLLESHGTPIVEQSILAFIRSDGAAPSPWISVRKEIATIQSAQHFDLEFFLPAKSIFDIELWPEGSVNNIPSTVVLKARDVTLERPLLEQNSGVQLPEDSAWLVHYDRYKPNWLEDGRPVSNNLGFRAGDVALPKPPHVFRIVCVGGSTTDEGGILGNYPVHLQAGLRRRFGTAQIEVINAGVMGANTYTQLRRFKDFLACEPDLILWYGMINDLTRVHFHRWCDELLENGPLMRHSAFLSRWLNRCMMPSEKEMVAQFEATTYRNLRAMNLAARTNGVDFVIASFAFPEVPIYDILARCYYEADLVPIARNTWYIPLHAYQRSIRVHNEAVKAMCERERIAYLPFGQQFHGGKESFSDICHMTGDGIEAKAALMSRLLGEYLETAHPLTVKGKTDGFE
jgi:lysophospholipase L1-like esterase